MTNHSKTLIVGTSYVDSQHKRELLRFWGEVMAERNPGCDLMVVDSASPVQFPMPEAPEGGRAIFWGFPDNIGHLSRGGRDGAGRALCRGFEYAIDHDYDYVAVTGCGFLVLTSLLPTLDRMRRSGVRFAAPMDMTYRFLECGIICADVGYLRDSRFVERYDWASMMAGVLPERRIEELAADDLFLLPFRGARNDLDAITPANLRQCFPWSCDYITHCQDFAVYRAALDMAGLGHLAGMGSAVG